MKSEGKDLLEAEQQALDYLHNLPDAEFPDWVLTSDFKTFRLLNLKTGSDDAAAEWSLENFRDHADKLAFLAGYGQRALSFEEREAASIEAAQLMAPLYEGLAETGYDEKAASVFMVRLLFMLYADDTALWGERDQPVRSDGKLTVKSLAEEAGVKRWVLTHRHQDFQIEFRDRVARHGADPEPIRLLKGRLRDLEQKNQHLRAELREAKATTAMLERQIAVETLEPTLGRTEASPAPRLRAVPELKQPTTESAPEPEG